MIDKLIGDISTVMYSYVLIILLLATGLYFTFRTRFVQFRMFLESIRVVGEKPEKAGATSSFQALMVSTASRVGTGNIIGISTAICAGGFGAVFWMWVIAIIGGASAFVESTLAQIYKRRDPETGESYGGPSYYIEAALHSRPLAIIFAFSLILTYAGGFNMLASYNLQSTFSGYSFYDPETTPWVIGAILALLVGYCVMGGGKRIVKVTSTLVPFMGGLYVLVSLIVIVMNFGLLPQVLGRIFSEAFDFQAIFGGLAGSCLMYGIKRGLYSNEAGEGSAPVLHSAADVEHPAEQGIAGVTEVFLDTFVICTITGLVLGVTGVIAPGISGNVLPLYAFESVWPPMRYVLAASLLLFSTTSLMSQWYFGFVGLNYMFGRTVAEKFKYIFPCFCIFGATLKSDMVWTIQDIALGLLTIPNLIAMIFLWPKVRKATKEFFGTPRT